MSYADRVKEASTSTGTGSISLSGAPTGFRTFAAGFTVGATMPYAISDAAGNWEIGTGTLSGSTTLARTTVLASSNANALVSFPAGSKDVFCTLAADNIARGMVNKDDAGFDIVLCAGQSNMVGYGNTASAAIDCADSRVYQFGSYSSDSATYQLIVSGVDPLKNSDGSAGLGPATAFAKAYASTIPTNRRVLLVPICVGGTTMVAGTPRWNAGSPGGDLYESAISQSNAAIAKAILHYPNSRFVGLIWLQGESDGDSSVSQATYVTAFKAVIAGFRSRITGASSSFAVIAGMSPEAISAHAGYPAINLAHQQVATETNGCTFVAGPSGNTQADNLHYAAPGQRILGARLGLAAYAASIYAAGPPPAATAITMTGPTTGVASAASTNFTVALSPVAGTASSTTVTPSDASGGGTFTPTSVVLSTSTQSATFTYTPNSTVTTRTISVTNNGGLTNPSAISYSVTAAATVPGAPTIGTATGAAASASVAFTAPGSNGGSAIIDYTVTSSPGGFTATGAGSPLTVSGLTNGTAYTFTVTARNSVGSSAASAASNSVTPAAASSPRLSNITRMVESGTGPYTYTTSGAGSYGGGEGDGYLQLNADDGELVAQLLNAPTSNNELMLALDVSSATAQYLTMDYAVVSHNTGYTAFANGAGYGSASAVVGANGDYFKAKRAGTTVTFEVSKDTGSTYTNVATWTGVPTGVLYFHCMPTGVSSFKLVSSVGTP